MALGARVVVLIPGVVHAVVSPYREHVALLLFVVFVASVFAGRRYRLSTFVLTTVLFVLVVTPIISVYRNIQWSGMEVDVAVEEFNPRSWFDQESDAPPDTPWYAASRRFHAFDSLLLTIDLVPEIFPYSERAIFSSAVTRAFVPRGLWTGKEASDRGLVFSRTIWGFDDGSSVVEAAIAPSMPGDLFEVGGIVYIVAGALAWGLLLGLCDRWIQGLTAPAAAMALALLSFQAFGGIERDFAHCVSTLIQTLLVMFAITYVLVAAITSTPLLAARGTPVVPQRDPV